MPVDHAALRAAKLAAHQAALPPEQRIINRTDFDKFVTKKASVLTRDNRAGARKAFIATVSDPTIGICDTPEEAEAYFLPLRDAGKPFTCTLLRKFLEASAVSRTGRIEEKLSSRSLQGLMINLFGAAKQAGNPVERQVRKDTLLWLETSMLDEGLVHRKARDKATPIPEDITSFLRCLFDRKFSSSVHTTRDVLLIALFVCLLVDCSARVSDLLTPSMSEANYAKYKIEHKNKFFTWGCVEVFAFRDQGTSPTTSVYLQAKLSFNSIKDTHNKGYKLKTIPLRLLPPTHTAEDSLFWLMVLGLIDGVFDGISSWEDIDRLQPGPNGLQIPIKYGWKDSPVFRNATRKPSSKSDLISKEQMRSSAMLTYLHKLSRFCGLKHAMLPNVLRRGSAYFLSLAVNKEERCARMGHTDTDPTYWSSYRNTTSTVDFQALRHGLEQENVAMMSSVFLGTNNSGPQHKPPERVSAEGMAKVRRDAQLLDLLSEQSALSDELLVQYGSFEKARAADPKRYADYMQVRSKYGNREGHLVTREYKIEYKAFWEGRRHAGPDEPQQQQQQPTPPTTPAAYQPDEIEHLLDELDREPDDSLDSADAVDPQQEADSAEALSSLVADLDEGEAAGDFLDDVQEEDAGDAGDQQRPETGTGESSPASRSFAPRQVARYTLVDELAAHLYGQPETPTWNSLSAYFVTAFDHLHEADRFYPGQEPLPGTRSCRFCGYDLSEIREEKIGGAFSSQRSHIHAHLCEGERLAQGVIDRLEARGEAAVSTACPLPKLDKTGGTALIACSSQLVDSPAFSKHVLGHHQGRAGLYCLAHGAPLCFSNWPDHRTHAVVAHDMPASILKYKRLDGKFDPKEVVFFCPFCQVWIPRTAELEEDHLATHFDDAVETVTTLGLAGGWRLFRWTHPAFCPFCLYDATLSATTRFKQFPEPRFLMSHISMHLKGQEDSAGMLCPATALTPEGLPQCSNLAFFNNPSEMADHLREAHDLDVEAPVKEQESDGVQAGKGSKKRRKTNATADRNPLQETDANQQAVVERGGKK